MLVASATSMRAQYNWHVAHSDQILDTQFAFRSVSCSGNNCTVGAIKVDFSPFQLQGLFYQSTDGGKSWYTQIPKVNFPANFFNIGFTKIQRIDSLNIVAISDSGLVLRSFDAGNTWERQICPTSYLLTDVHFSDPMTGIITAAGASNNVFLTSDGGKDWSISHFSDPFLAQCHSYGNGKFRILKYAFGPIYTTYDSFENVDSTSLIFDSLTVPRWYAYIVTYCTFGGGDTILAYGRFAQKDTLDAYDGNGLIIRSLDGGKHWEKPFTFPNIYFTQIEYTTDMNRDTVIAVGHSANHILLSTDRGASWKVDSLVIDTSYSADWPGGIAMTSDAHLIASFSPSPLLNGQSVLIRGEISKANVYDMIAYETHVYPNPAAGIVTVSSIDVSRQVFVYDLLGREVLKGTLSTSGNITFDLTSFPPSLYTIILNHNGKMIPVGKIVHQK